MDKNTTAVTRAPTQVDQTGDGATDILKSAPSDATHVDAEQPLMHGGQLSTMAQRYHIEEKDWLDLSTGIAPIAYPVGIIPTACWQRLPQNNEGLLHAARGYYQTHHLLPTPGSQSIIQMLPQLCRARGFANSRVWLPKVGYQEHRKAWQKDQYQTLDYTDVTELSQIGYKDIVLLINPNNPTGEHYPKAYVDQLHKDIHAKQGLLIIDEAFMDATPEESMVQAFRRLNSATPQQVGAKHQDYSDALIILRSVGKFFGLAGIRLGFVLANETWLNAMALLLGPWAVSGPALFVGEQALADKRWQEEQRVVLWRLSSALQSTLKQLFTQPVHGTLLFKTVHTPNAPAIFDALCQQGIYVRLCDEKDALRFGIANEQGLIRLKDALHTSPIQRLL